MADQKQAHSGLDKNNFIQSWRGIAVLLVIYYHFTNRVPPEFLNMADGPSIIFYSGKLGVLIFFIISGYLITHSLSVSQNLGQFYAKRISRIWPLFILASVIIFLFLQFVEPPIVPSGPKQFFSEERDWIDLTGSLFFLEDLGFRWMDGVFWSILVELKYYFWVGLLAYFRPHSFVRDFAAIAILVSLIETSIAHFGPSNLRWIATGLNGLFIAQYLPFFAIGALLTAPKHRDYLSILIIIATVQLILKSGANPDFNMIGTLKFSLLLIALLLLDQLLFQSRMIMHVGEYSYSFYLFHQMIGLSLIKAVSGYISYDGALIVALFATYAIAVFASWMAEWRFRPVLIKYLERLFTALKFDRLELANSDTVSNP